ncbi:Zn-ribbon domain-containing OB-fold protein [Nitratireductor alexandrii]|uniref:Zn-ribbon domain-containing OB-fold protein n=1 Tax=Nitratireductor alexandrii TaxID=2448161 RepID=UPI000FDBF5E0|nr:OB-fold domain-containing protein [Nitratireductor alexandrii]
MTNGSAAQAPDREYQEFLNEGRFVIQKCGACGAYQFAPRVLCTSCGSDALAWQDASGQGVVYAATTICQKPERGGDYSYVLVELDEGVRMISTVLDRPPLDVAVGLPVVAEIEAGDPARVVFRGVEGAA